MEEEAGAEVGLRVQKPPRDLARGSVARRSILLRRHPLSLLALPSLSSRHDPVRRVLYAPLLRLLRHRYRGRRYHGLLPNQCQELVLGRLYGYQQPD